MLIENDFGVPVGTALAWELLTDMPRVAPCLPGAQLTGVQGSGAEAVHSGDLRVKVGPMTMRFAGTARFAELDQAGLRIVIEAAGRELRGASTATATVSAVLRPAGDAEPGRPGGAGTRVEVGTELRINGKLAQFGRSALQEISTKLIGEFAANLAAELERSAQPPRSPARSAPESPAERETEAPAQPDAEPLQLLSGGPAALVRTVPAGVVVAAGVVVGAVVLRRFSSSRFSSRG